MPEKNIVIVGAGLVGSLLSLLLSKKGYNIDVYEKRPDMRKSGAKGGRSINLALSDRGWKALKMAGIAGAIEEIAIPMKGRLMHSTDSELTFQAYGKEGQSIYSVSRARLNELLMEEAEKIGVRYHFEQQCEDVDSENGVINFSGSSGKPKKINADVIFGTDGAFSAIRTSFLKRDRFTYSQQYLSHGYKELEIKPDRNGEFQMEENVLHIWPRGDYMLIALPNPDKTFTCTLFFPFEGEPSFASLNSDEAITKFFETQFPDARDLMPNLLEMYNSNPTSSLVTVKCYPWVFDSKVCLLGDASHAIVPFYGQGMNSGFEDCSVLMQILENNKNDNWALILDKFQKSRKPDADGISELALQNFIEMRDSVANKDFLLQKKIEARINDLYPNKWMPLYSMVTFSHKPYAEALAKGRFQDRLMKEVLGIEGIEEEYLKESFKELIRPFVERNANFKMADKKK
ncbi:FAD-dependent monooxygenase [Hyphobacterium sp. CCMP332]|nr:FAD-dependent monooxygenase [Hyphobacterium sp. CCMP332]